MEFVLLFLIFISTIKGVKNYRRIQRIERPKKRAWSGFAEHTQMTFVPAAHLFRPSRIEGTYRGMDVTIGTTERAPDLYTKIRLTKPTSSDLTTVPTPDIEHIEHLLNRGKSTLLYYAQRIELNRNGLLFEERQIRSQVHKLKQIVDYLCDLTVMSDQVVALGGEVVPFLTPIVLDFGNPLNATALRLLQAIEYRTRSEFAWRLKDVRCKKCLDCYVAHKITTGRLSSVQYYACRTCGTSRSYYDKVSPILVLDNKMQAKWMLEDNALYVNGFKRKKLFDFDSVMINRASDKEAASLAIKVGNDTDEFRTERYEDMLCTVLESCALSENTMHMLKRVFGRVQIQKAK